MDPFNDIKNIWQNQSETKVPSVSEITQLAHKHRSQLITKTILGIASLCATVLIIGAIGLLCEFKYSSTKLGLIVVLLAVLGGITVNAQLLRILQKMVDSTADNNAYLQQLIIYRNKQRAIQTKGLTIYFLALTGGLLMYMFEFLMRDLRFGIVAYSITLAWIGFAWFYLRPRAIKKQEEKINHLIAQLENVSRQFAAS